MKNKSEFMRKRTRWLTSSKEVAEVLRGDGRWKRDKRFVHMTGKSETVSECLASLVVAMLKAIKRQMISDGVIRVEDMHFAGPVPDEGPLMLKWVDKMKGEKCRSRLVCREIKKARDRDEQLGPEDVFSPMPPSEGLKMFVSTMMTGHDDENHVDGRFEMATWDVSRAHFYGEARRWSYTST